MFSKRLKILFLALGIFFAAGFEGSLSFNDGYGQEPPAITAITNVRIFDGENVIRADSVILKEGKVEAVGIKLPVPEGAKLIDGSGKTLLPGLIDSHIHTTSPESLKQSLVFGVTSVIDMFMDVKLMNSIKELQARREAPDMAHLVSPGFLATSPGGHGTQYGLSLPTLSSSDEAPGFVDDRISDGSDFIKIILDDGSAYNSPRPTLSLDIVRALIEAAHKRGKIVIIHAATLENCIEVMNAGADGLAHLYFNDAFDPDFGQIAARNQAFVIPTLTVLEGMSGSGSGAALAEDVRLSPFLKPQDVQNLRSKLPITTGDAAYRAAEKGLTQLKAAGVPILAGTDAPNPNTTYGASLHHELALLVKAGLTPEEALRAATSLPAEKFSLTGRGRIKPGMTADLLLVNGDPLKEIEATRDIVMVWKEGREVNREAYRQLVVKEKSSVEELMKSPPPENSGSGWVSDFEGEKIAANFGAGWMVSTDALMGGKSTAQYNLAEGGAEGSRQSLFITGTITEGSAFRWAGASFMPGKTFMAPANLSSMKAISFYAKGQGQGFAVLVFTRTMGFIPAIQTFAVGPEWKEYTFSWESFGIEAFDITQVFIGAYQALGDFSLHVDNVRMVPELRHP